MCFKSRAITTICLLDDKGVDPMNMNQVVNMVVRIVMRKGISAALSRGMGMFRGGRNNQNNPPAQNQDQRQPSQDDDRNFS